MSGNRRIAAVRALAALVLVGVAAPTAWGQRVRFPAAPVGASPASPAPGTGGLGWTPAGRTWTPTSGTVPATAPPLLAQQFSPTPQPGLPPPPSAYAPGAAPSLAPVPGAGGTAAPGGLLGAPFDPYAGADAASTAPSLLQPPSATPFGGIPTAPAPTAPGGVAPYYGGTPYYGTPPPAPSFGAPGAAAYPGVPQQPGYLYPNGVPAGYGANGPFGQPLPGPYLRFIQDFGVRYTWLPGSSGRQLDINDAQISATLNWPNFLFTGQPVRITPVGAFHFWGGPSPPATGDLPAQAYSAYLDAYWRSDPNQVLGAEVDFNVGVFTDFNTFVTESIRYQGTGAGIVRLTPRLALKGGVTYLDRNKIKLLPVAGLIWTPNPQVNFEVVFPNPKLSQYLVTLGVYEVWWYVAGEYGGGAWTIQRAAGTTDEIDINDIRVILGAEWFSRATTLRGFLEVGYVFDREIVYVRTPADTTSLSDTFMIRAGASF